MANQSHSPPPWAWFCCGSSFEESVLNQVQGSDWPAADNVEWIPPTQLDELVRRVEEACKKSKRSTPQRECAVPVMRPQSSFMSKSILINIKKALRRGAGRARGSITAGFTSPVSEQYFMRFWWGRGDINRRPKKNSQTWTVVFNGPREPTFRTIGAILNSQKWFVRFHGMWRNRESPGPCSFVDYDPSKGERGCIVVRLKWQRVLDIDFDGVHGEQQRVLHVRFPINSR